MLNKLRDTALLVAIATVVVLALGASPAAADPEIKWQQPPDLADTGIDVDATTYTLADDFLCTQTGPITQIDIWASWRDDGMPGGEPLDVVFDLSIHSNVEGPPSHPGTLLWEHSIQCIPYPESSGVPEGWLSPPLTYEPMSDSNVWRYECHVPEQDWFYQEEGNIYWLDLHAWLFEPGQYWLGWKTTDLPSRWNDDAVWGIAPDWTPLFYPETHPWMFESLDLAFRIWGQAMSSTSVGGLAELPDVSDSSAPNYMALAGLAGAALVALTAGAWYARRRWLG
jgi:hypothetical protein